MSRSSAPSCGVEGEGEEEVEEEGEGEGEGERVGEVGDRGSAPSARSL